MTAEFPGPPPSPSANMPFCVNCGQPVTPTDVFCGHCGARQNAAAPPPPPPPRTSTSGLDTGFTPRQASIFSYTPWLGWIMALIVLATDRFRLEREARFHAFQGLYLFVAYLIADRVLKPTFRSAHLPLNPGGLLEFGIIVLGIYLMIQTAQGQLIRLPLLGDLAEKSVAEQNR